MSNTIQRQVFWRWPSGTSPIASGVMRRVGNGVAVGVRVGGVAELGDAALELEADLAGRAVALLRDDHFRLAVGAFHLLAPSRGIGVVVAWLLGREVIILTVDKEHDIGVLLDR